MNELNDADAYRNNKLQMKLRKCRCNITTTHSCKCNHSFLTDSPDLKIDPRIKESLSTDRMKNTCSVKNVIPFKKYSHTHTLCDIKYNGPLKY